jgi:hypothetical protein
MIIIISPRRTISAKNKVSKITNNYLVSRINNEYFIYLTYRIINVNIINIINPDAAKGRSQQ